MDDDLGWNDFELRSYDPQISRFLQHDPYDQFASGYVGMRNDAVNNIDPSGGFVGPGFQTIGGFWNGSFLSQIGSGFSLGINISANAMSWAGIAMKAIGLTSQGISLGKNIRGHNQNARQSETPTANGSGDEDLNMNYGIWFTSPEAAAYDWGKKYNGASISDNTERSSFIYSQTFKQNNKKKKYYRYTDPVKGEKDKYFVPFSKINENYKQIPKTSVAEAWIHSHGDYTSSRVLENFSPDLGYDKNNEPYKDRGVASHYNLDAFLTTPSGKLRFTPPGINMNKQICDCLTDFKGRAIKEPTKEDLKNFSDPDWKPKLLIPQ